ncbi:hypothetical protein SJS42_18720 [Aeromonas caviae]|uniref:hypothetical protein n=1 Tax=Aeromonas caviae TaxID=648 RepID=UPI0029D6FE6A|nr:hypothetical protein [Aeromonas caviae]MDX7800670.1 hypothetical protein [Aeromonas caviae]
MKMIVFLIAPLLTASCSAEYLSSLIVMPKHITSGDSFLGKHKNEPSGRVELNETYHQQASVIEKNQVSKHERTFISPGVISDEADEVFFFDKVDYDLGFSLPYTYSLPILYKTPYEPLTDNSDINIFVPEKQDDKIFGVLSFSEVLSILAVIISMYSIYRARKDLSKNKIDEINEGYWLREVIIPSIMEPVIDFSKNAKDSYIHANRDLTVFFSAFYLRMNDRLLNSIVVTQVISQTLYDDLKERIIDLDDDLGNVRTDGDIDIIANEFVSFVVNRIKTEQLKLVS